MPPEEKQPQKMQIDGQLLLPQKEGNVFAELKSDVQKWVNVFKTALKPMETTFLGVAASTPVMIGGETDTTKTKNDIKEIPQTEQIKLPTEQPEEIQRQKEKIQKNLIFSFVGGNQNSLGANYTYQTLKMWEELGGEIESQHLYAYLRRMFDLGLQFYTQLETIGGLPKNVSAKEITYYAIGQWLDNIYSPHVRDAFNLKLPDLPNLNLLYEEAKRKYETNPTENNYKNYVSLQYTKDYFERIYNAFKIMKKPAPMWLERAIGVKSSTKSREEEVIDFMEDFLRSYEAQQEQIQRYFGQPPQVYKLK